MGGIWHRASNLNVQFRSPILSFEIACFKINITVSGSSRR